MFSRSNSIIIYDCKNCKFKGCLEDETLCDDCLNNKCSNTKTICKNNDCWVCFNKSFASHPKSKLWNYTLNNNIKPRHISKGSHKKCWFNCDKCNHVFESTIRGGGCQYCANKKRCIEENCDHCFNNSFASHPKAEFWDYDKNKENPRDIAKANNNKFWFNCNECKHSFDITLVNILFNHWCPYCVNQKRCIDENCEHCFKKSFASHPKAEFWDYDKNKEKPRDIAKATNNKFWFNCNECNHEFSSSLSDISSGGWCPYCCISSRKSCDKEDCEHCFNKSFASHPKSKFVKDKNIDLTQIAIGSHDIIDFICDNCNHEFNSVINDVSREERWCPYCANRKRCIEENCDHCFNNSFASHPKAEFWDYDKNKENPRDIAKASNNKFWFNCNECNHSFDITLDSISTNNNWCRYCVNAERCDKDECEYCFNNSFASDPKAKFVKDKTIDLRKVSKATDSLKLEFTCDKCKKDFSSFPYNISKGHWCPHCLNKTEIKLYEYLLTLNSNITRQFKPDFCKNIQTNRHLPYDFEIKSKKVIIELDGAQHFIQINNWTCPEDTLLRDVYKMKCAINNGYKVIRLLQEEVFADKFNWKNELKKVLDNIENEENIVYITPNITMYRKHIELYTLD